MKRLPRAYSREKRKAQVLGQFQIWNDNGDNQPKTMYRIAKALAMTPQKRITELLLEMVSAGDLTVEERDQSGRWTTRFYALSPIRTLSIVVLKRRVIVKHKGLETGQLEMWS